MKIGYRRVSSEGQNLDRQDLVCDKLFEEKVSGAKRDREALSAMIEFARQGDEVIVWSIDRLARDLRDLQDIIQRLNDKGVGVSFLKEKLTFSGDADDAVARLQLQMMGAFAEFERNIIRQRQAEGIARAKARGVYKGRKQTLDRKSILSMKAAGWGVTQMSETLGVSRMSIYRILKNA
ncbi:MULTISPECIES: recombinase family protein [unclassified Aliiroseovarius]|uniref:recombinase family protein n=1 Tax=unclassified Aliiroseovarius TaxID=2623558 RepID=UPI0015681561|nr:MULTISPECIES: recombinase family protein [unclassified Aliiroseovarius]NRP31052.1 Transposon Tn3 resolvase [Aliiroseovarius sp. xm-m-314]NRP80694.1 Transposon Tn3 resolvase [Aliiroseovarius sp. xm-v-209]